MEHHKLAETKSTKHVISRTDRIPLFQDAILELVKTACSLRKAAIDLCRKHGLLSWCHGIMLCRYRKGGNITKFCPVHLFCFLVSNRDQQLHKVGKVISIMLRLVSTFKTTGSFVVSSLQEIVWVCTTVLGLLRWVKKSTFI